MPGVVIERNGISFGFLAYTYDQSNGNHTDTDDRVAMMDVAQMQQDVAQIGGAGRCDHRVHARGRRVLTKANAQQVHSRGPPSMRARASWWGIIRT